MGRFNVKNLVVELGDTVPFEIPELAPNAVIHLAHAGEINEDYWNARFADEFANANRKAVRGKSRRKLIDEAIKKARSPEQKKKDRDRDRELFPRFIMRHWENVPDEEGNVVEFSVEAAQELVDQLCEHPSTAEIFDRMRNCAADIDNFRELPETEETEKNSSSD